MVGNERGMKVEWPLLLYVHTKFHENPPVLRIIGKLEGREQTRT
jgi:hypothetical protein